MTGFLEEAPMVPDTLFTKIARREIPAKFVHEDADCFVIEDIAPKAPFHVLVIPRLPIPSLGAARPEDAPLLGHLLAVAKRVAEAAGHGGAFRVVTNSGAGAGQTVPHLHFHVLAGRALGDLG